MYHTTNDHHIRKNYLNIRSSKQVDHLNIRRQKPFKTFNILNIES